MHGVRRRWAVTSVIANTHDIGQLFRVAAAQFRARRGVAPEVALPGASRALLGVGGACEDPEVRAYVFERALRAASSEQRSTWTMDVLMALAAVHEPARATALTVAREELSRKNATNASSQVLVRASIECLATLVSLVPRDERVALFRETEVAWKSMSFPPYDLPRLLARAAPGLADVAPEVLLAAIALSHEYYRALGYALVAHALAPPWRERAIAAALENEADPSLCDARVFVAIAPHLSRELYPRALELASRLHSSPSFGATAMRALLPGWAALGNAEDAVLRARTIGWDADRGVALALGAIHLADAAECDRVVAEGIALVKDARGGAELLELPRDVVLARWLTVFEQGFAADRDEPFEDECGYGLVEWMPFVPLLGGDQGAREVADAIAP